MFGLYTLVQVTTSCLYFLPEQRLLLSVKMMDAGAILVRSASDTTILT